MLLLLLLLFFVLWLDYSSAAKNGHLNILKILSAYGADFNAMDSKKNTPMHYAATYGYGAVCKYLGQRGKWF